MASADFGFLERFFLGTHFATCAEHRGDVASRRRRPEDHVDSRGITTTASVSREDAIDA